MNPFCHSITNRTTSRWGKRKVQVGFYRRASFELNFTPLEWAEQFITFKCRAIFFTSFRSLAFYLHLVHTYCVNTCKLIRTWIRLLPASVNVLVLFINGVSMCCSLRCCVISNHSYCGHYYFQPLTTTPTNSVGKERRTERKCVRKSEKSPSSGINHNSVSLP